MQLPYRPTNVFHRHGGKIVEVVEIRIQKEKPSGGYSRDAWYFMGRVKWNDGSGSDDKLCPIDMPMLCTDTPYGHVEINGLSDLMMAYLNEHGEWRKSKPQGWYAHRETKTA